jgi:hypothetical protein
MPRAGPRKRVHGHIESYRRGRDIGPESRATNVEAVADLLGMTPADVRSAIATMKSDGMMNSLTGSTAVGRGRARC